MQIEFSLGEKQNYYELCYPFSSPVYCPLTSALFDTAVRAAAALYRPWDIVRRTTIRKTAFHTGGERVGVFSPKPCWSINLQCGNVRGGGAKLTQWVAQVAAAQEWQQQQQHESGGCTPRFQHRIKGDKRSAQVLPLATQSWKKKPSLRYLQQTFAPLRHWLSKEFRSIGGRFFWKQLIPGKMLSCSDSYFTAFTCTCILHRPLAPSSPHKPYPMQFLHS